jgi:lysozyme family protein
MTFDDVFDRTLGHEGGYSDDPGDPGGETHWGITWPVLLQGIGAGIIPPGTTIKTLTREHAKRLYDVFFWRAINADRLIERGFDGVAFQLFDFAVNSGIPTAIRKLQTACGVADDGRWGPISQAALERMSESDLIMLVSAERLEYMTKLRNWPHASRGWARRIANNLRHGAADSE